MVICPLLFAPKFCDNRISSTDSNFLSKIIKINQWIKDFNTETTGLTVNLDAQGVHDIPTDASRGVQHKYEEWNEPQWSRMLHLSPDAKSIIAREVLDVFKKLE